MCQSSVPGPCSQLQMENDTFWLTENTFYSRLNIKFIFGQKKIYCKNFKNHFLEQVTGGFPKNIINTTPISLLQLAIQFICFV